MNKLLVLSCACIVFTAFSEVVNLKVGPRVEPTPQEREDRRAKKRLQRMIKNGGRLLDYRAMAGEFHFINCQKRVSLDKLQYLERQLYAIYRSQFKFSHLDEPFSIDAATRLLLKDKATAAVFVIDKEDYPTMLVAPESKWAAVNVRALSEDKPTGRVLDRRIEKEVQRAFAALVGGERLQSILFV